MLSTLPPTPPSTPMNVIDFDYLNLTPESHLSDNSTFDPLTPTNSPTSPSPFNDYLFTSPITPNNPETPSSPIPPKNAAKIWNLKQTLE